MATINLTGRLSAISTNGGTITKSGSKYVVTGGVSVANGGIIDVPLLVDYLEFDGITYPNAIATIGLKDTPNNGDFFPIEVEITSAGAWSYNTNYRTRGNITMNTYNCIIKFTNANATGSAFGVWPGSGVAQTGVKWNAENVDIICLAGQNAPTLNTSQLFPAGGGTLKNVTFQGSEKIFFTSSPLSTDNVVNVRSTGVAFGFTADNSSFELIGGSSDYVAAQRAGTATFTDFQVKNGFKMEFADQLPKTLVFKKRFSANISGVGNMKFWVWDKNKTNVINDSTDGSGKYISSAVEWQKFVYTTGSAAITNTSTDINTTATNLKSPFLVRSFRYGYRPLQTTLSVNVANVATKSPHELSGIPIPDTYQSGSKSVVDSYTEFNTVANIYRKFFSWYEDNGHTAYGTDINLPEGGDIYDFKDWNIIVSPGYNDGEFIVNLATKGIACNASSILGKIKTTGTVTIDSGITIGSGSYFEVGELNIRQNALPNALEGIVVIGITKINEVNNREVTLTNCSFGTISNNSAGTVTFNKINSTITNGTRVSSYYGKSFSYTLSGGRMIIRKPDNSVYVNGIFIDGTVDFKNTDQQGTYTYIVAKYGKQSLSGSFVVDTSSSNSSIASFSAFFIPDSKVTEPDVANVIQYANIGTNIGERLYDWISYYNGTNGGLLNPVLITKTSNTINLGTYKLGSSALGVSGNTINIGTAVTSGINIVTSETQTGITPTYPQQIIDAVGTTNWLKVNLEAGMVHMNSFDSVYRTVGTNTTFITLIPSSFTNDITIYTGKRGKKKAIKVIAYGTSLFQEQTPFLETDSAVVNINFDFLANGVYVDTMQEIYDAFAQFMLTQDYIANSYMPLFAGGTLDFIGKNIDFKSDLGTTLELTATDVKMRALQVQSGTYCTSGTYQNDLGDLEDDVKIRASNIDSEIILPSSVNSIRLYPTLEDQEANTNQGIIISSRTFRYKHGGTQGVGSGQTTMVSPLHTRINFTDGSIKLMVLSITAGEYIIPLSTDDKIDALNGNLQKINRNIIKASKLIPASEIF